MNRKQIVSKCIVWSMLFLSAMTVACHDEQTTENTDTDKVYIAVNEQIDFTWVPRIYGPDKVIMEMTDGKKDAQVKDIAIDAQQNLHAVGFHMNSKGVLSAVYWKNSTPVFLTDSTESVFSVATSIAISGNDVYISGYTQKEGKEIAVYWKNQEITELTQGLTHANATDIFVSGNDVYVTGFEKHTKGYSEARIWKNGTAENLTNGTNATSIFVSNSSVYVAGDFYGKGKYWQDGVYKSLGDTPGRGTGSVFIANESVYMTTEGRYWKDNTSFDLTTTNVSPAVSCLYVFKDDIYVGGYALQDDKLVARYWKNGEAVDLTDGTNPANISSIVVIDAL